MITNAGSSPDALCRWLQEVVSEFLGVSAAKINTGGATASPPPPASASLLFDYPTLHALTRLLRSKLFREGDEVATTGPCRGRAQTAWTSQRALNEYL